MGGRRIMRNVLLDQQSIGFLSADDVKGLKRFRLLSDYLVEKQKEIDAWNAELKEAGKEPVNTRRITNIGTFRAYVLQYLRSHKHIHQNMTLMVRQLSQLRKVSLYRCMLLRIPLHGPNMKAFSPTYSTIYSLFCQSLGCAYIKAQAGAIFQC